MVPQGKQGEVELQGIQGERVRGDLMANKAYLELMGSKGKKAAEGPLGTLEPPTVFQSKEGEVLLDHLVIMASLGNEVVWGLLEDRVCQDMQVLADPLVWKLDLADHLAHVDSRGKLAFQDYQARGASLASLENLVTRETLGVQVPLAHLASQDILVLKVKKVTPLVFLVRLVTEDSVGKMGCLLHLVTKENKENLDFQVHQGLRG